MNWIVYKTTNKINNKIYIGVHKTKDPNIFDNYYGSGNAIKYALKKYGKCNFIREILFIYPGDKEGRKLAFQKEKELVTRDFIQNNTNYNLIVGGIEAIGENKQTKVAQYDLEGNYIRFFNSITEAEAEIKSGDISQVLIRKANIAGGFQWKYYTGDNSNIEAARIKEKAVYQFDLSGNLLKTWCSVTEASKQFNNQHSARVAICNVCNKITRKAYGYYWSFKRKFEYVAFGVAVAAYTEEGELVQIFDKLKEAADFIGVTSSNILSSIKGSQKLCGGYRWRYFYGNKSSIKPLKR